MTRLDHALAAALLNGAMAAARALPDGAAHAFGRWLGLTWFHVIRFRRRLVVDNLEKAYGGTLGRNDIRRLARDNFVHYGLLLVELLRLRRLVGENLDHTVEFRGLETLDRALARGQGAIALTAHLGNYDLQAMAVARRGYAVTIVSKPLRNKAVERVWMAERSSSGLRISLHRNSLREIVRALRANGVIGFVLDQHASADAVWVEFFGRPAATLRSLAVIAGRTGAAVVPVFAWRLPDGRHVIEAREEIPFETVGDSDADVLHNTRRYSDVVERAVRAHPDQWTWIHRRWKQPPPDVVL